MEKNNEQQKVEQRKVKIDGLSLTSTNSLNTKTNITTPNVKGIIKAVAVILSSQLMQDIQSGQEIPPDSDLQYFSEQQYMAEKPEEFDEARRAMLRQTPSDDNIEEFIQSLYDCAQFSPQCCIISLVYINRLIAFTELRLYPTNWRPLILCSLLVAQKVWDDSYLRNADFAFIYPFFVTKEINLLQQKFLQLLQYNVTVKSGIYAQYYFELRDIYKHDQQEFPIKPLDITSASCLQERSIEVGQKEGEKAQSRTLNQSDFSKPTKL